MKKNVYRKYIDSMDKGCPDMDRLWEKISAGAQNPGDSADDISPFERALEDCQSDSRRLPVRIISAAAAAAVLVIAVALRGIMPVDIAVSEAEYRENAAEASFNSADTEELSSNAVASVASWEYSTHCDFADSYSVLSLAKSYSEPYTGISLPEGSPEYFVEEQVLAETDGFLDCRVISAEEISSTTVRYLVEVIHFIGGEGETASRETEVVSHSPYALRTGREYLLPIKQTDGAAEIAFDNAPQIEITADRQVVCHNGWRSLVSNAGVIEYPQVYPGDFFFDRMNVTAESSLERLFDKWRAASS